MSQNLLIVAGQVLTLFLMMAVGFVLRKTKKLTQPAQSQLTFLLLYVVAPCLIVNSMQVERNADTLRAMGSAVLACVVFFVIGMLVTPLFFKKKPPDTRDVLRFGSFYPNAGFMGFPLIRAILGEEAMVFATVFLVMFQLFHWTHGVVLMGGKQHASIKSAVLNPGLFGFVIGLLFFLLNIRLPQPVANAVSFMSDINTPMAMLVIGAIMADADILRLLRIPYLYAAGAVKLLLLPALTAVAIYPLGLQPIVYCSIVILSAAPTAGVTSMFADRFGRDTASAARLMTLTTLFSILTLPIFAAVAEIVAARL